MNESRNPLMEGASLLYQVAPGALLPYEYRGVRPEIKAYQTSAWIGTALMISPIYDVYGPDVIKFFNSICTNDFSKLGMKGLRHAVICNEKGQIMTDGVAIKVAEDRIRTYWLNPPLAYLVESSEMDVHGEDMSGKEYIIQIDGEKSLEILEDAFQADLHDIKFARHRCQDVDGKTVRIIRLGMSGNLAYEIHGDISEFVYIYDKVWESGKKFGAQKLGLHAYNLFNHTEAGFPNINLHYPLPWFESGDGLANYLYQHPETAFYNIKRYLLGSVGDDLDSRFMTPFDVGWDFLVKFNHDFTGKDALLKLAEEKRRTAVTLEWNGEDVGKIFTTKLIPGEEPCEDISVQSDVFWNEQPEEPGFTYRADKVFAGENQIGISSGRIISYNYNSMISLGFINSKYAKEGTKLEILWGTPGTRQMKVRATVKKLPYNSEFIRNENKDVEEIPHLF